MSNGKLVSTHIGILGAAFDPPTLGHQNVVNQALKHFDHILLVPSMAHPFQKTMTPLAHRLAMLQLFQKHWSAKKVSMSLIEQDLLAQKESGPIYTFDVLCALEQSLGPCAKLTFIIGPDNLKYWDKFYRADEIKQRWGLFVADEVIAIRSTDVRHLISEQTQNKSLEQSLLKLVDKNIAAYILKRHLYTSPPAVP